MGFVSSILGAGGGENTYNVGAPPIQTQNLTSQISALTPQQQQLTQMLMNQSQGNGPNPAQNMLNQATNSNIQQTAGQIASTKGISPALAARLGAQSGAAAKQASAGQAATMGAEQQINAENSLSGNLLSQQQILQNAQAQQNSAINQGTLGANNINAGAASQNAKTNAGALGGALGGIGNVAAFALHDGGEVRHYADGSTSVHPAPGGKSKGKKVPAMVSPEEVYIPPEKVLAAKKSKNPLKHGEKIPGKAPHPGNDPRNDIVPKDLKAGGVVIPNNVTQASSPAAKAKAFMAEIAKNKMAEGGEVKGFNRVLVAKQHLKKAHDALKEAHKVIGKMK